MPQTWRQLASRAAAAGSMAAAALHQSSTGASMPASHLVETVCRNRLSMVLFLGLSCRIGHAAAVRGSALLHPRCRDLPAWLVIEMYLTQTAAH